MPVPDPIPVLWLCGPPGVGKSTVGWEIFTQLAAPNITGEAGIRTGHVDIDQLGMCYGGPMRCRGLTSRCAGCTPDGSS